MAILSRFEAYVPLSTDATIITDTKICRTTAKKKSHRREEAKKSFFVAGKEIMAKQLVEALHSLPEEKRQTVLLYYFFEWRM
ncbi:MAG: hypothetical protein Q4D90_02660 [bacterium]|nr:hypothetical protein [bacterium]